jgi:hypothetical protein
MGKIMIRILSVICAISTLWLAGCSIQQPFINTQSIDKGQLNSASTPRLDKGAINEQAHQPSRTKSIPAFTLPDDADRSNMREQQELMKSGVYMTKSGEMALLPSAQLTQSPNLNNPSDTRTTVKQVEIPSDQKVFIPLK